VKFKDYQFTPKNRRGLSSVVGALLFVVLMVSAFSMFGIALDNQGGMAKTAKIVANADLKKQQEDFTINSKRISRLIFLQTLINY
jgi:flagellin-like protein